MDHVLVETLGLNGETESTGAHPGPGEPGHPPPTYGPTGGIPDVQVVLPLTTRVLSAAAGDGATVTDATVVVASRPTVAVIRRNLPVAVNLPVAINARPSFLGALRSDA